MKSQDTSHEILIPVGKLAFLAFAEFFLREGRLRCVQAEHVDDHTSDQRQDFRGIVLPDRAGILAEIDIEHPMKLVLHRPVRSNRLGHVFRGHLTRRDVVALLQVTAPTTGLTQRGDHGDASAIRPILCIDGSLLDRCHPGNLADHAPMTTIQVFETRHLCALFLDKGVADLLQQARLIALDHQQIIAALVDDLSGNVFLAAHSVDTDEKAFYVQGFEQFRNGGDLIALRINAFLAKDDAQVSGESTDDMRRSAGAIGRAKNRLAINRHLSRRRSRRDNLAHPAAKERFELLRIQGAEQTIEGRRGRCAVLERQKLLQPGLASIRPHGKVLAGVHVTETGADSDHQHFPEVVERAITGCSGVFDLIEAVHQAEASMAHFVRPKDESRPDSRRVYNTYA